MFTLQNVLFPDTEICECEEMYYHKYDDTCIFDGYFNLFSCGKWKKYTEVVFVELFVELYGKCTISLYSEDGCILRKNLGYGESGCKSRLENNTSLRDDIIESCIKIPDSQLKNFLWFSITPLSEDFRLLKASYITEQEPTNRVRLAGDICTFRREEYVKRNLKSLRDKILDNPKSPLYGKLDIFVVDNGQTLRITDLTGDANSYSPKLLEGSETYGFSESTGGKIYLIPNFNAGGSGGFTRGMIEALQRREEAGYTHIILMDDDAVLEPDAFIRCYALLSYMRPEYKDSCVAGSLLDLDDPYKQDEAGAFYQNGNPIPIGSETDLRERNKVIKNEEIRKADYAGWWWACFPFGFVREDNLPLPFFIHFDDMEYGLRSKSEIIYLNGICVWHTGFDRRRPQTDLYYGIRNRLITNAVHGKKISKWSELSRCLNEMSYHVLKYQYSASDLVLRAVKDFAAGPESFAELDPEKTNQEIRSMADKYVPYGQLGNNAEEISQIETYANNAATSTDLKQVNRLVYLLTLNGWLLPARKNTDRVVCCNIFRPDLQELYRAKEAVLIDPYAGSGTRVRKNYVLAGGCLIKMAQVAWIMMTKYDRSADAYRQSCKNLTDKGFWKNYLKL